MRKQLAKYLRLHNLGLSEDQAVRFAFKKSYAELDSAMRNYVARHLTERGFSTGPDGLALPQVDVKVTTLDRDLQYQAQVAHDASLLQVGDEDSLAKWIDEVLAENPEEAKRYLGGEKKLQGVLVGMVMRKSGGKADPKRVNQLLMSRSGGG